MPAVGSELNINTNANSMAMAQTIMGDGVTVVGASYSGWQHSSGIYTGADTTMPGVAPSDEGVIFSTGRARDITQSNGDPNRNTNTSTNTAGQSNNDDFNEIAGTNTYDASFIDIDFIPTGDTMTLQFVYLSEEYPEYSNSVYNDTVGVWINGTNVPTVVGDGSNSVGNVNQTDNINLFQSNTNDDYNTEMDGFTVTMTLTIPVNAGQLNSIRIGIADVADSNYDSNLMIAADSAQTTLVAEHDAVTMQEGTTKNVDVLANDVNTTGGTLTITKINGQAVSAGDTITLATGQQVTLLADGTFDISTDTDNDTISFTYGIESSTGQTDTGFVTVDTIPCFVAGTLIETAAGPVPVERLAPGDLIVTQDDGLQPIRWAGRRRVVAAGALAPISIGANALGTHGPLLLSPQHRVMLRDSLAELLFGTGEVLVKAKDLVNDRNIRPLPGGEVTYVHLMFDRHQVIFAEGLATESFLPGPQTTRAFEREIVQEITTLFPELDAETGAGYSPAARLSLKGYEAQVLLDAAGSAA